MYEKTPVEVQIRTQEMEDKCENPDGELSHSVQKTFSVPQKYESRFLEILHFLKERIARYPSDFYKEVKVEDSPNSIQEDDSMNKTSERRDMLRGFLKQFLDALRVMPS